MGMSKLRWGLGVLITLLALASAARALSAYFSHHLWLGSSTVALLAVIAVAGCVSLARARQRIEIELVGLLSEPPRGELVTARLSRLRAVRDSGAALDRDALAAATEADERGRAYLGRYLVAVTVLVGLVGTFAGLMETLHGVGPLLRDDQVSTLKLLAAPLGGLDVTFGASIVGILVTLALALVQGDLVLAEERALSRLEERTVHRFVPELWPPTDRAEERTARELAGLRGELGAVLQTAAESVARRVAGVAGAEVDKLMHKVAGTLDSAVETTARGWPASPARSRLSWPRPARAQSAALALLVEETRGGLELSAPRRGRAGGARQGGTAATCRRSRRVAREAGSAAGRALHPRRAHARRAARRAGGRTRAPRCRLRGAARGSGRVARPRGRRAGRVPRRRDPVARSAPGLRSRRACGAQGRGAVALERAGAALAALTERHAASLAETSLTTTAMAKEALAATRQELTHQAESAASSARAAGSEVAHAVAHSIDQLVHATDAAATQLTASSNSVNRTLAASSEALAGALTASGGAALESLASQHAGAVASLAEQHQAVTHALRATVGETGARIETAAAALERASAELRAGSDTLAPLLSQLAPELAALSREVALLAARAEPGDEALVTAEIVRIGEGVERLEALARLSGGRPGGESA